MIKLFLRKTVLADGTSSLVLKIFKDKKASITQTGIKLKHADWDAEKQRVKSNHPNSKRLNNLLLKKLSEANDKYLELETIHTTVSSKSVMKKIRPNAGATFFKQAEIYLAELKEAGKYNRYTADKPRVKHFKEFLDDTDISFSDITVPLLERFKAHCINKLKLSERTAINHLVVIRSVFSDAIKNELINAKYYPFGKGKIAIKFPPSQKIGLGIEDVKKLEQVELKEKHHNHARNLWLVSFYFAGMRVSDLLRLKWSDFKDDRLHYTMGKNLKTGSLKTPEKVIKILLQYEPDKQNIDDYVFPELKNVDSNDKFIVQRRIAHTASRIDKILRTHVMPAAKITNKVTMHIARHSFAHIAGDKIPLQVLQELFRHSTILVTMGYMGNFINKKTDDALNTVLNFDAV